MAYATRSVDNLGPPFLLADEGVFLIPKGGSLRLAKHYFKLLLILEGEIEHEIDGMPGRRPLVPGDILVAPVVGRHHYINPNPTKAIPMQAFRMFLDGDYLAGIAKKRVKRPEADIADFIVHHFNRVVQLSGGIDTAIMELIGEFRRETEQRSVGFRHRIRALCTELIVHVARKIGKLGEQGETVEASPGNQIVSAAKEYIFKHYAKDLTLGEIAWHVGKGEEHLARVFKRETGQSVFDYVRETRIEHAKTLLLNPARTLTQIAELCGFHSLSFLSRSFSQQVGMSPSLYRRHTETTQQKLPPLRKLKLNQS